MALLYIGVVGHNGAGKTHLATKLAGDLNLNRVNGDDFRHFVREHIAYFHDVDFSYPSNLGSALNPLVNGYRLDMCLLLLKADQSVINDGSGANREFRQKYLSTFKANLPKLTTILIWANADETELLRRLAEREKQDSGSRWRDMHHDVRKQLFEPPEPNEADLVLEYNQHNYDEIRQQLQKLL